MAWQVDVVGASHTELEDGITQSIARTEAVRSFVRAVPITEPMELTARETRKGGLQIDLRPVGTREPNPALAWLVRRVRAAFLRKCRVCGQPRAAGTAFCSMACHTAWRQQDAERRGYVTD